MSLPVINSCDDCGACCMRQSSPPGYIQFICQPDIDHIGTAWEEDFERFQKLPAEARRELEAYVAKLRRGDFDGVLGGDFPCCWLDLKTRQCRWYEHRPTICEFELERGDDGCRRWRQELHDSNGARERLRKLLSMFKLRRDQS